MASSDPFPTERLASFQYRPLEHEDDIRIIKVLPGNFTDDITIEILHETLHEPAQSRPPSLTLGEARSALPTGWRVIENAQRRFVFTPPGLDEEVWSKRTWVHPNPDVDPARYLPPTDEEHWSFKPGYEALSYAWGSSSTPCHVFVSPTEGAGRRSFDVGRNLFDALRHLRQSDQARCLWVDKICINQEDNGEKSLQVRRMSRIYQLARRVIVWLGRADRKAGKVIQFLKDTGSGLDYSPSSDTFEPVGATARFDPAAVTPPRMWARLYDFLERPWFNRLWTLQEINLADQNHALMQCGSQQLPWYLFVRALGALYWGREEPPPVYVLSHISNLLERSGMSPTQPFSLLLFYTAHLACFDKRDMVYGLLGLAPTGFARSILPDYTKSVEEIYRTTFLSHLAHLKRWEIIGPDWHERKISAPSWVPDLSVYRTCRESTCQTIAGPSEISFSVNGDVLTVAGVRCATISWVGDSLPGSKRGAITVPLAKAVAAWWTKIGGKANDQYLTGGTNLDAFLLTLAQGDVASRWWYGDCSSPTLEEWRQIVGPILKSSIQGPQILQKPSKSNLLGSDVGGILPDSCLGRRFMVSKEGHFGLVPVCAAPGDIICVILGLDRPVILRPMPDALYRVMGYGYIHGIEDASALIGPLPSGWRAGVRQTIGERHGLMQWFYDPPTKTYTREDPRMQPHPEWERIYTAEEIGHGITGDDPMWYAFFRHKVTGEIRNSDPRLTSEALKEGGVPIENFSLI